MTKVIPINQPRLFTLEEARSLLPAIKKITEKSLDAFLNLEERLQLHAEDSDGWAQIEAQIIQVLEQWNQKIVKLGAHTKGLWLVDFDNGEGYYCWRYGDEAVNHFHGYQEGYASRVAIS